MSEFRARRTGGFTLVELLVVVAVIAVIAGLAVPVSQRLIAQGRATSCVNNLRSLGVALNLYLSENNLTMPELRALRADKTEEVPVIDNTLNRHLATPAAFACPADEKGFAVTTGTSYYWNAALNGQALADLNFLVFIEDKSRIPLLADKEGFHEYSENKVNILFADGHATKELKFFTTN